MAEIKIEKKKPVWPWILLTIIIISIIAYLVYNEQESDDYSDDVTSDQVDDMDSTIYNDTLVVDETYNTELDSTDMMLPLTETMRDTTRFGIDSTYTKKALYNVANATLMKARKLNLETSSAMTDLEQYVNETKGMGEATIPKSDGKSDLKKISGTIVTVIEAIQTKFATTQTQAVADLKTTAAKLNATTPLAKQQRNLQIFFRQVYDLLNNMNS